MKSLGETVKITFGTNQVEFDVSTEMVECKIILENQNSVKIISTKPLSALFKSNLFLKCNFSLISYNISISS